MKPRLFLLLLWLVGLSAVPAEAKSYSAERFDSHIWLFAGGAIEVTETVVFRFVDGPFTFVFREIPRRGTDSIEVIRATMDGRELPTGDQPGHVELGGNSRLRVQWHFPEPVSNSTHTFTLTYRVEGVVRQSEDGDLLAWRALPEQRYSIDSSTIEIDYRCRSLRPPDVDFVVPPFRGPSSAWLPPMGDLGPTRPFGARFDIGKDGWVEARLHFAPGSVIASPPLGQAARERADALAPSWLWAAALVAAAGLVLLWSLRLRNDQPRRDSTFAGASGAPPDSMAPAIAGALAANGRVSLAHAMAALFSIADRARSSSGGTAQVRTAQLRAGAPSRQAGAGASRTGGARPRVRRRAGGRAAGVAVQGEASLQSHIARFRDAVHGEMATMGLIDAGRKFVHARYGAVSLVLLLLGAAGLFVGLWRSSRSIGAGP
jgi:hypothetical protein